jgi:DNA-binding MarR family transcriptional regulator
MKTDFPTLYLLNRLKRNLDRLTLDMHKVYQLTGSGFEPRWFPVFMHLSENGPSAVKDIAQRLGVTHPAVTQIANELTSKGLVTAYRDTKDRRKRVLAVTTQGKQLYEETEPLWHDLELAMHDLLQELGPDLQALTDNLESRTSINRLLDIFQEKRRWTPSRGDIEIIDFVPEYAPLFKDLNQAWIEEYFTTVEEDERVLDDPQATIVYPGGAVIFARDQRTRLILGTAALINCHDGSGELVKMAVDKMAQGRKIGRMLGEAIIERARARGMHELYLETNSQLVPALNLYRSLGFETVDLNPHSEFERADVRMKLILTSHPTQLPLQ